MLKGREIRGLVVYAGNQREEVGRVSDLIIREPSGQVEALVIAGNGLLQRNLYVPMVSVRSISKAGIVVPNKSQIKKLPKNAATLSQKGWLGSKLYSAQGEDKGTVADVLVKDGKLAGLEISAGILGDLHQRREFIPWEQVDNVTGDFVEGHWQ